MLELIELMELIVDIGNKIYNCEKTYKSAMPFIF